MSVCSPRSTFRPEQPALSTVGEARGSENAISDDQAWGQDIQLAKVTLSGQLLNLELCNLRKVALQRMALS